MQYSCEDGHRNRAASRHVRAAGADKRGSTVAEQNPSKQDNRPMLEPGVRRAEGNALCICAQLHNARGLDSRQCLCCRLFDAN